MCWLQTDKEVVKPYLEAVTQWKADVVLDMIREGMKALQRNPISSPLIKRNKSAKTVCMHVMSSIFLVFSRRATLKVFVLFGLYSF